MTSEINITIQDQFTNLPAKVSVFFKVDEAKNLESLIQENTKILYIETPTNPGVDVLDLEKLGEIAKKHNIPLLRPFT